LIQTVVTVTAAVILLTILWAARDALMLIYISALIAMGFSPLVQGIERRRPVDGRRRVPRALAILVVYIAAIGVIARIGLAVLPTLVTQARELAGRLPQWFDGLQRFLIQYKLLGRRVTLQEVL